MMTSGAHTVSTADTVAMATEAAVSRRLTSSSPLRWRSACTICGTRIALSTPPITRLYSWVGRLFAMLNASAAPEAVAPRAAISRALRTSPSRRLASVPAAITALERAIDEPLSLLLMSSPRRVGALPCAARDARFAQCRRRAGRQVRPPTLGYPWTPSRRARAYGWSAAPRRRCRQRPAA